MSTAVSSGTPSVNSPFVCATCGAAYTRAEYLKRHERNHAPIRPFQCEGCPKNFARSDLLLRHRRRCHAESFEQVPSAGPSKQAQDSRKRRRDAIRPYPAVQTGADNSNGNADLRNQASPDTNSPATLLGESSDSPSTIDGSPPTLLNSSFMAATQAAAAKSRINADLPDFAALFQPPGGDPSVKDFLNGAVTLNGNTTYLSPASFGVDQSFTFTDFLGNSSDAMLLDQLTQIQRKNEFFKQLPPVPVDDEFLKKKERIRAIRESADTTDWANFTGETTTDEVEPEIQIIHSEGRVLDMLIGVQPRDPADQFYLNPGLFRGCYTLPHWLLPPIAKMSDYAALTYHETLDHLGMIHKPSFKLSTAHVYIAFAMCTMAPLHRRSGPSRLQSLSGEKVQLEPFADVQHLLRTEKVDTLVKMFAHGHRRNLLRPRDRLSMVQSLILYSSHSFLSNDSAERLAGELALPSLVRIARQSEFFDPKTEAAQPQVIPSNDIQNKWIKWTELESTRRTMWLMYLVDTIASFESVSAALVSPRDVSHLALPCPQLIWAAPTASEWSVAQTMHFARGFTLDDALKQLFDDVESKYDGPNMIEILPLGPFARMAMMISLVRGLLAFGRGETKGGLVTRYWVLPAMATTPTCYKKSILAAYHRAMERWRKGWDADQACQCPMVLTAAPNKEVEGGAINLLIHDALPFYWLAVMIHTQLTSEEPPVPAANPKPLGYEDWEGIDRLMSVDVKGMFSVAKQFVKMGEGRFQNIDEEEQDDDLHLMGVVA